jgi:hypothetical protein
MTVSSLPLPATASAEFSRAEHESSQADEEPHNHVHTGDNPVDVQSRQPRGFRIRTDDVDVPTKRPRKVPEANKSSRNMNQNTRVNAEVVVARFGYLSASDRLFK